MSKISKKLLLLNTKDVKPVGSQNTYRFNLSNLSTQNVVSCSIRSISVPNIFENIITDGDYRNNTFWIDIDGIDVPLTIDERGFYTVTEIVDILKPKIENAFATSGLAPLPVLDVFEYDDKIGKIKIQVTGDPAYTISFDSSIQYSMNKMLGITSIIILDIVTPTLTFFQSRPDLYGATMLSIHSSVLSNDYTLTNVGNKLLSTNSAIHIPVNSAYGGLITYISDDLELSQIDYNDSHDLTSIDVRFKRADGYSLDFENLSAQVELVIFYANV